MSVLHSQLIAKASHCNLQTLFLLLQKAGDLSLRRQIFPCCLLHLCFPQMAVEGGAKRCHLFTHPLVTKLDYKTNSLDLELC